MDIKKALFLVTSVFCMQAQSQASNCCNNLYFDVEFLYCNASNDDFDFALIPQIRFEPGPFLEANAPQRSIDFEWDPGFRLAFGTALDCPWGIDLIGTYLHSKSFGSGRADGADLHPLWFQSFTGRTAETADASWALDFATIDLVGSYACRPWNRFVVSPYFGLRSAFIRQKYEIDYRDIAFALIDNSMLTFPAADVDLSSRFLSIGFTAGAGFSIPLGCNFTFDGGVGGSLVYGRNKIDENVRGAFPFMMDEEQALLPLHLALPTKEHYVRANLEAETGFSYVRCCPCGVFEFSIGYFFSVWFNQNNFYNLEFTTTNLVDLELSDNLITIDRKRGDLQIQGLVLRAALHF